MMAVGKIKEGPSWGCGHLFYYTTQPNLNLSTVIKALLAFINIL